MNDGFQAGFLATKTQRPRLPAGLIVRRRLFDRLEAARNKRLTIIKAAAGFGKTSLAIARAEHLQESGIRVAWYSLDRDDDEPAQFLLYVARALSQAGAASASRALGLIAEVTLIRPLDAVRLLINELAELSGEVFLFLDDYHIVTHPGIDACVAYLLRHAPSHLHLVLTTRTEPNLPLARLRAQNQLLEIDSSALRFDLEETGRFMQQEVSACLPPETASRLHEKTEGWPAMMRIVAATSVQSGQDFSRYVNDLSSRNRPIRSHIVDMLEGLPEPLTGFLLRVSILDSLCAGLCQAVSRQTDSQALLEDVATRRLLLTPLDADGLWFRCHNLLRGFLRQRLEMERPDEVAELHRRAYAWYAGEGMWTDAVRHAIAAGDTAEAAGWIENCAMTLLKRGELLALLTWERLVPAEMMRRQVKARLAIAWGMALAMRFDEALHLATAIETELADTDPRTREAIGCECQTIRACAYALGDDTDSALPLAEDSLRRNSSGPWTGNVASNVAMICWWQRGDAERCHALPWISFPGDDGGRNVVATVYRFCLLGIVDSKGLNSHAARRQYRNGFRVAADNAGPDSAAASQPASLLAYDLYDQGRLDEAEAMLAGRLPAINAVCMLECVLRAYVVLVRISVHRGEIEHALDLLDQAGSLGTSRRWWRLVARIELERARIELAGGHAAAAASCLARIKDLATITEAAMPTMHGEISGIAVLAETELLSARGAHAEAARRLQDLKRRAQSAQDARLALEVSVRLSAELMLSGATEAAAAVFRPLQAQVTAAGTPQAFLDLPEHALAVMPQLIAVVETLTVGAIGAGSASHSLQTAGSGGGRADVAQAAAKGLAVPPDAQPVPTRAIGIEANCGKVAGSLSPREYRVLALLVEGQTNKDIARMLNIAPETVKSHVKNILGKLGASNRSQAVSRALGLGLVSAA